MYKGSNKIVKRYLGGSNKITKKYKGSVLFYVPTEPVEPEEITSVPLGLNMASNIAYIAVGQYQDVLRADFIPEPNTQYTLSIVIPVGEKYYINEHLFTYALSATGDGTRQSFTVTAAATIDKTNTEQYYGGRWRVFKNASSSTASGTASQFMMEEGASLSTYEEFKGYFYDENLTQPIPQGEIITGTYYVSNTDPVVVDPTHAYKATDYATGDGTTDDSGGLVAAMAATPTDETLWLEGGVYNLNGNTINVPSNITIKGTGTIKNGKLHIDSKDYVTIDTIITDDLWMEIAYSSNITIKNSTFANITRDVLGFINMRNDCHNITIDNNIFTDITTATSTTTYASGIRMDLWATTFSNITISNNEFTNIGGPAGVYILTNGGSTDGTINTMDISYNTFTNTDHFGIEFYQYSVSLICNATYVHHNTMRYIGYLRAPGVGNGSGGIYSNITQGTLYVHNNDIRHVCEVGIEGYYTDIYDNYIEDTGADQLNHTITDSAGIYLKGPSARNNTIVNPGEYGGIHYFAFGQMSNKTITGNVITNDFDYWEASTHYDVGDLVVKNSTWYECKTSGTSGTTGPSGITGDIADGSVIWDYKKPFAIYAVNLNAQDNLDHITITDNISNDLSTFASLGDLDNDNILVQNNTQNTSGLTQGETITYVGGYGNRTGDSISIS